MTTLPGNGPSLAEIETMAARAVRQLPEVFAAHLGDVIVQVEDFADRELLDKLGIDDPIRLSGVYEGVPLHVRSISDSGRLPDRIRLFRQPILAEWRARGGLSVERLVWHVLVHEVGHHFGLTDETMHALEDEAAAEQIETP
ncbi:MAG: metallopeptidase family protein [Croceibacterium sp.]